MNIIVLNGSPKIENSFTMQYIRFIEKKFPQHNFTIVNIAPRIGIIEKDNVLYDDIMLKIGKAECIIWAFSVHFFLVPSQYKRFIELVFERNSAHVFKNKYTAILETSIHYFDQTAKNYMHAICDDLNMNFIGAFTPDMYDLEKESERKRLVLFAESIFAFIEHKIPMAKRYQPLLTNKEFNYVPSGITDKICLDNKKMIILYDSLRCTDNLSKMVKRFRDCFSDDVEILHLKDINMKGGCLGCLSCGPDNVCVYNGKDEFIDICNTKLKFADIIIFAGDIHDRYLSATWKRFFDRSFFSTHIPLLQGRQIGFLISGPLKQMPNIVEIFEGYAEWQQANLVDFITDESGDSVAIDRLLQNFAKQVAWFAGEKYIKPHTFLGVAGMKIFRDETWGRFRFVLQANDKFFRKKNMYDFPQKNFRANIANAVMMPLTSIPIVRKIFRRELHRLMIMPLKAIVDRTPKG